MKLESQHLVGLVLILLIEYFPSFGFYQGGMFLGDLRVGSSFSSHKYMNRFYFHFVRII